MEDNAVVPADVDHNENCPIALLSRESRERAYIRFVNMTNKIIELIWINFTGQYVRYQLLGQQSYSNIDTYKTHPWVAQDLLTKDRLWLDKNYVYMPRTTQEYLHEYQNRNPNMVYPIPPPQIRKVVFITYPILSLRYWSLVRLRNLFAQPEAVDNLELPRDLKEDLKKMITLRNRRLAANAVTMPGTHLR